MVSINDLNGQVKDAKYFGVRIGDRCWYDNNIYEILAVQIVYKRDNEFSVVIINICNKSHLLIDNGKGITFDPPKKKVKKEMNVWVEPAISNPNFCEEGFCRVFGNKLYDNCIEAKLTFEIEE